jgi:hypothetical protein
MNFITNFVFLYFRPQKLEKKNIFDLFSYKFSTFLNFFDVFFEFFKPMIYHENFYYINLGPQEFEKKSLFMKNYFKFFLKFLTDMIFLDNSFSFLNKDLKIFQKRVFYPFLVFLIFLHYVSTDPNGAVVMTTDC